jgi:hypothetical protein
MIGLRGGGKVDWGLPLPGVDHAACSVNYWAQIDHGWIDGENMVELVDKQKKSGEVSSQ